VFSTGKGSLFPEKRPTFPCVKKVGYERGHFFQKPLQGHGESSTFAPVNVYKPSTDKSSTINLNPLKFQDYGRQ